jgi:deazaflavin-dependent oxidoreductase (nitroreductase family)
LVAHGAFGDDKDAGRRTTKTTASYPAAISTAPSWAATKKDVPDWAVERVPLRPMEEQARKPWLPPRWFIRLAWVVHRAIYRLSRGRRGLRVPTPGRFGLMRLRTVGRRTGKERAVILGYYEDGPNLVTLAMNGWAQPEPAWWLNLRARPEAAVDLKGGVRAVRARAATNEERARLWRGFKEYTGWGDDVEGYARLRRVETAVVVLEPTSGAARQA